jgi:serine/threonine-protein kinase RsbW
MMKSKTKHRKKKVAFEMICRSYPKEVACIESFLQRISASLKMDDGTMYRLLVSCTEAVNNAIIHGNQSDPDKKVVIKCLVGKRVLTIRVKDQGTGFDAESLLDPRDEKNLLKENGRGVFLMRSMMDGVKFKKLKSGLVVEMKLKLHGYPYEFLGRVEK